MPSFRTVLPLFALALLLLHSQASAAVMDFRYRYLTVTVTVTAPCKPTTTPKPISSTVVTSSTKSTSNPTTKPPVSTVTPTSSIPINTQPVVVPSSSSSIDPPEPTPVLPVNGGSTELPAPLPTLFFKHTTFGRGYQNYTCPTNASAAPVSAGALATLFDLTALEIASPRSVDSIPALAVTIPFTPSATSLAPFTVPGVGSFPVIGLHFFTPALVPVFDLFTTGETIFAKKIAAIPAPASASTGPMGTGAVPWLALVDNGTGLSVGLGEVYRVVTAGGNPPATCAGLTPDANGIISVPYAAEYWFYSTTP